MEGPNSPFLLRKPKETVDEKAAPQRWMEGPSRVYRLLVAGRLCSIVVGFPFPGLVHEVKCGGEVRSLLLMAPESCRRITGRFQRSRSWTPEAQDTQIRNVAGFSSSPGRCTACSRSGLSSPMGKGEFCCWWMRVQARQFFR
jgi:hypothetical protein